MHCHRQKVGLNRSPEKRVRYQKCEAPFGPFRFLDLTPFSSPTLKPGSDKALDFLCRVADKFSTRSEAPAWERDKRTGPTRLRFELVLWRLPGGPRITGDAGGFDTV